VLRLSKQKNMELETGMYVENRTGYCCDVCSVISVFDLIISATRLQFYDQMMSLLEHVHFLRSRT